MHSTEQNYDPQEGYTASSLQVNAGNSSTKRTLMISLNCLNSYSASDTLKQDNDSTVRGDGGSRVGEVRAGTTSPMPEHKGFMLH